MVFNSYTFLIFMVLLLGLHALPLSWPVRKFNLLWASYLFYAAWNPPFVLLLVLSTVVDWFVAKWIYRTEATWKRRLILVLSLLGNLGVLAYFKYGTFILRNAQGVLSLAGVNVEVPLLDIILPAGISFYTFQTLSYTLDVYMRRATPWTSFLDFALYVTFFPQLVAGPILRASDFLPQCRAPALRVRGQLGWGFSLIVLGLFEKIVVADGVFAPVVEQVYGVAGPHAALAAWTGTVAFAGQIFCDFAGYSTCAIGAALCFGFHLPTNFNFPYAALGFSDFWRRWHISLSTWLRDYLYIPLGGNRRGRVRTYVNLMATMLIGGLWHGASWTFVVWGGLHGLYLAIERLLEPWWPRLGRLTGRAGRAAGMILTFAAVCYTWVFFRARSFDEAFQLVSAMSGRRVLEAVAGPGSFQTAIVWLAMGLLLGLQIYFRHRSLESAAARAPRWVLVLALSGMLAAIVLAPGDDRAFIYFQF